MKKLVVLFCFFNLALVSYSQAPVRVTGTFAKSLKEFVSIYKVVDGGLQEISRSIPQQDDNRFGFVFYPEYEGFYTIGTGEIGRMMGKNDFYFKPGERLEIALSDTSYIITNKNASKENLVLSKWHRQLFPILQIVVNWSHKATRSTVFVPKLEAVHKSIEKFAAQNKTGNKVFDNQLVSYLKWNLAYLAGVYFETHIVPKGDKVEKGSFIEALSDINSFVGTAEQAYKMPQGRKTVLGLISMYQQLPQIQYPSGFENFKKEVALLQNDTLKGDVVLYYMARQKDFANYKPILDLYEKTIITDNQQERHMAVLSKIAPLEKGYPGLNFTLPDKDGKMYTFSDYKGKVVLVDMWANWCHACRSEVPALKKLEKELEGKDFVVIGLSLDFERDRDKWLQAMKDDGTEHGIQLFVDGWGFVTKYYQVTTIPRFLLFDKQGNIITVNAPRPSNPKLKSLIEEYLRN